jgi:predicted SprT family Zn-dependent metalloprotease
MPLPNDTPEARAAILAKVKEVLALARELYPDFRYQRDPVVTFDVRGRSCGGYGSSTRLRFNLDWYAANPEEYLAKTVPHEVAHCVCDATGSGTGHKIRWKKMDIALGGSNGGMGKRCASLHEVKGVVKARRTVEHRYISDQGNEKWVGTVQHNRLQHTGKLIRIYGQGAANYHLTYKATGEKVRWDGYQRDCRMAG